MFNVVLQCWVQFKGCMFLEKVLVAFCFFICYEQMVIDKVKFINIIDIKHLIYR